MEQFIKDEQARLNWLKEKIQRSLELWMLEKPEELEFISDKYLNAVVKRMINNEIDYLHEAPEDYVELYGEGLYGEEWNKLFGNII